MPTSFFLCVCAQLCLTFCDSMDFSHQAPLSVEFSRQEYWSELPFPPPGDLSDPGIEARSSALQADSLLSEWPGKPTTCAGTHNQEGSHAWCITLLSPSWNSLFYLWACVLQLKLNGTGVCVWVEEIPQYECPLFTDASFTFSICDIPWAQSFQDPWNMRLRRIQSKKVTSTTE